MKRGLAVPAAVLGAVLWLLPWGQANPADDCLTATAQAAPWLHRPFEAPLADSFTAEVDVTPLQTNVDAAVALSLGRPTSWDGLAAIVRFGPSGRIDARSGSGYVPGTIPYAAGVTYRVKMVVDVARHTYSAFVAAGGGPEQVIGTGLAFRTSQSGVPQLDHWTVAAAVGSLRACGFTSGCSQASAGGGWTQGSFAAQTGTFTAEFEATPAHVQDSVVALSSGAQQAYDAFACLVRFNSAGRIDVRDGGTYRADVVVPYGGARAYRFRLVVDVASRRYSVYVTPPGAAEQRIARDYAFRTSQATVTRLDHWGVVVGSPGGSTRVCGFQVRAAGVKIAFVADIATSSRGRAVYSLIKAEGAEAVVASGDLDYADNPAGWESQVDAVLGGDFPYFATIGNHDTATWDAPEGYQARIERRLRRLAIPWTGRLGVMSSLHYKGIFLVQLGVGTRPGGPDDGRYAAYLRDRLAADNSVWSVASWHKNQHKMQACTKSNETGWGVYEEARKGGAIAATAHEHSYIRTHLMSGYSDNPQVASTSNTLALTKGRNLTFVSGLGGASIRGDCVPGNWFAAKYTADSSPPATHGALFCTFGADGDPRKASCYFKAVDGRVPDRFTVVSNVEP